MKKIFSPIIILSMMLTLFSFGCRYAMYPQHESKSPGYLGVFFFVNNLTGNCAVTLKVAANTYRATALQIPRLVCVDPIKYYVGAADEGTTHAAATQILTDANAKSLEVFNVILNGPSSGANSCASSKTVIAGLPAPAYGTTGTSLYTYATVTAPGAPTCVQVTDAYALDQLYYCPMAAVQAGYAAARAAQLKYIVIGDAKGAAFATNLTNQVAGLPVGSFTAAQTANTNTIDKDWASIMYQTPQGAAFTFINTYDHGASCGKYIIAPDGLNNKDVRGQAARLGATADNTLYGITAVDIAAVSSPVVYDILLSGTSRVGLGLICGTSGVIAPLTSAKSSTPGNCALDTTIAF